MKRFEYRIDSFYDATEPETRANAIGADGWELVAIDRQERWIFKRPLVEETIQPTDPDVAFRGKDHVHRSALTGRQRGRKLL